MPPKERELPLFPLNAVLFPTTALPLQIFEERYKLMLKDCLNADSMLGVVLADHMLLTVLFWELTSISSFFLIGWDRDDEEAVKRATQTFVTTGLGGLSFLGGVLLLGDATGSWRWSGLVTGASDIGSGGTIVAAFILIFIGAASKSAQWPFHYWLPGAMLAPPPVSAYLHSATMVKAGVFLLGRLLPVFGLLSLWLPVVVAFGAVTMLLGAVLALQQHELNADSSQ